MGRTLKMGFAMGGGVSLGSFSGAGLAESIKQAVLNAGYYTKDETGKEIFNRYEKIVIDVFSGASAGSLALAVMLRALVHQTQEEIAQATADLMKEGINLPSLEEEKRKDLVAAQVVMNLQHKIWVKEVNLDKLLGETTAQKAELTHEPGLIRRGALEKIAYDTFRLEEAFASDFAGRRILAKEVLFASTLSNLTGIVYDTRPQNKNTPADVNPNYRGTKDPFTSRSHKELRVFHLNFEEVETRDIKNNPTKYPSMWVRYHVGDKQPGYISDLRSKNPWARMVATSMACGAFPFAFEPVALERFEFEFVKNCWNDKELSLDVCRNAMDMQDMTEANKSYPFCYVDGGTFNNEPVKEAFRLSAFLDAEDTSDFDRVVVFVDPSVGDEATNFRLPFLQQYSIREPRKLLGALDGYDMVQTSTLDRLLPHIGSLVGMITDEGRVKESNRIMQISKLFDKKEMYYQVFDTLITANTNTGEAIKTVLIPIEQILSTRQQSEVVPSGALTLAGELIRVCKKKDSGFYELMNYKDSFALETLSAIPDELQPLLLKALLRVFMDQLMDLSGKNEDYKIIAIAPEEIVNGVYKGLDLPGSPLEAFSGFASERANEYAMDLAVYCTQNLMKALKMLPADFQAVKKPDWSQEDKQKFLTDFSSKLPDINNRIDNLFHSSHVIDVFYGVDRIILSQLSKILKDSLANLDLEAQQRQSYRFIIEAGEAHLEIDGSGSFNDAAPVEIEGKLYLITELYYYPQMLNGKYWNGVHAQNDKLVIDTDGFSVLADKSFCTINLPIQEQVSIANRMPNPVFVYRKVSRQDKGKSLPASNWSIKPGLKLVEQTLLG